MIYEGANVPQGTVDCQAVVVGSGAAGAVVAKELAHAGVDVVLLEAGGYHHAARDFNQREEIMLPRLFYDQGARMSKDLSLTIQHGRGVGGSTVHNTSLCVPPNAAILDRWADEYGIEGMSYDDLRPSVERVFRNLGVHPMEPAQINANNALFKAGADTLGFKGFIPNHNRVDCVQAGYCSLGCTYDRKQSMLVTYIPKAVENGARVFADCRADKVLMDGGRATGIAATVVDRETGAPLHTVTIRAKTVILSAGAILSPALLMQSNVPDRSGLTGKTLRVHPSVPVAALFDQPIEAWRGIPQTYIVDEFCAFYKNGYDGYFIVPVFAHPGSVAVLTPGLGAAHAKVMRNYDRMAAAAPVIHDETKGTISVRRNGRIDVDYWPDAKDSKWIMHGLRKTAEIYLAAGAAEVLLPYPGGGIAKKMADLDVIEKRGVRKYDLGVASVHPQGSVPMAKDPKKGVLDSHCEHHNVRNLFVCDTSVFPTSLGTPPMIPTATIATHTAKYLVAERRKYFE